MSLRSKFAKVIQEKIDAQSELLLDGLCPDMVTYARACGTIYGLKMAMQEYGDLVASMNDEERTETE